MINQIHQKHSKVIFKKGKIMFETIITGIGWFICGVLILGPIIGLIVRIVIFFTETPEERKERDEQEMKLFFAKIKAISQSNGRYGWLDR
jgi:hypothetical protein